MLFVRLFGVNGCCIYIHDINIKCKLEFKDTIGLQ